MAMGNWREVFQDSEFSYTLLIFLLFVVPRFVARYGIPLAVTAFIMGIFTKFGLGLFTEDSVVRTLSSLGVTALFLFAGLEVDLHSIRRSSRTLIQQGTIALVMLAAVGWVLVHLFHLEVRASCLLALAVMTPSTGFILDSLDELALAESHKFWVKAIAISTELVALTIMFVAVQSVSVPRLAVSAVIMAALVLVLPKLFRMFALKIVPHAPGSEFGFLLMTAILAGMVTKKLGAYYLVGAFLVGVVGRQFEELVPEFSSKQLMHSIRLFASFFTPFYFFHAGLGLTREAISPKALLVGVLLLVIAIPFRLLATAVPRKWMLKEDFKDSLSIAISLMPNLVFGLVLADMLRELFKVDDYIYGGVIFYTMAVTIAPAFVLKNIVGDKYLSDFTGAQSDFFKNLDSPS